MQRLVLNTCKDQEAMITGTSFNLRRLFAEQRYSVLVTFDLITRLKYQRAQLSCRKS